jgi:hypothetical protein
MVSLSRPMVCLRGHYENSYRGSRLEKEFEKELAEEPFAGHASVKTIFRCGIPAS